MSRKIIIALVAVVVIVALIQGSKSDGKLPQKFTPGSVVSELISLKMLEDPGADSYTASEIASILEPRINQYVQFIEVEELSGTGGASGFVVTASNTGGIVILGSFFGSRYILEESVKVSSPGMITFTEAQSSSACSYSEQVMLVDTVNQKIVPQGASVLRSNCEDQ